ncbi:MAG: sugar ABC transporter ATP-binding protein [Rectinemataceae bacterium]
MSDTILEIVNLQKAYPGVVALDNVSMSFKRGEIHAIVGENGAGKSTLIKAITGAVVPDKGRIIFEGREHYRLDPKMSSHIGIGVIYQEFTLIPALSVAENIFLGNYSGNGVAVDFKDMNRKAVEAMKKIGVVIPPQKSVSELSIGRQQIVEIMRSLVKEIRLLIMDEPTAPLTTNEVEQLVKIVRSLKEQGITVIYISHRLEEVFRLADRVSVMRDGQYIATLNVSETNMKELIRYMVGRELKGKYPMREKPIGEEILRVEGLTGNGVRDISFTLHEGEILGFAGLLGCGRTETMQMLYGAAKKTAGKILLDGKEVEIKNTTVALRRGIGLIPEDRKRHGVFLAMTIRWNTSIGSIRKKLVKYGVIVNTKKEKSLALEYMTKLRTKAPSIEQIVANLSGGNQQKVVVSKVLATDARIMIFDEPTRGIDVGAKQEMSGLLRQLVNEGKSVLLVSSEMEEVIGLSDRIAVLCEGRLVRILEREEFDQERILTLASGLTV